MEAGRIVRIAEMVGRMDDGLKQLGPQDAPLVTEIVTEKAKWLKKS